MPLGRALGWSPQQFWRATWHDLTSHLWMQREMLKPFDPNAARRISVDDADAMKAMFRGLGQQG